MDEATDCIDRAVASAHTESSHAVATALNNCSYVLQCLGTVDKVYEFSQELHEHARSKGEQIFLRRSRMNRGWANCMSGRDDNAIEEYKQLINFLLESHEEIEITFNLGTLADLQIRNGDYNEAIKSLDQALKFAIKNNEKFYMAKLYQLKAHALELSGQDIATGDDADYRTMAAQVAKSQQARAWLDQLEQDRPQGRHNA